MHVGLGDLDVVEAGGGVERDGAGLGALADDLLVDLGLGGDVDDGVGEELRLAAEAAAGGEAADAVVALLDGVEGGEGVGEAVMPCLGKSPKAGVTWHLEQMPRPPQTEVEVDAEAPGGGEDRRAGGEAAALAGGGEDDEGVAGRAVHALVIARGTPRRNAPIRPAGARKRPRSVGPWRMPSDGGGSSKSA